MAVLSDEVKALFEGAKVVAFSTSTLDGQPNTCAVGMKKVIDDETVYVSDQFFKKTLANLKANAKVAIAFWGDGGAYQIHGTARYVDEGEEFAAQKAWVDAAFQAMGAPIVAKGGAFVHVDAVFQMSAGPDAGDRIA